MRIQILMSNQTSHTMETSRLDIHLTVHLIVNTK
jgi:hypothetical protein